MMNKKIEELAEKATSTHTHLSPSGSFEETTRYFDKEMFADLIIREHIKVLQQEWYNLNNDKDFDEQTRSNGDIRFRAGQKSEIIVLIEKIKKHWESE